MEYLENEESKGIYWIIFFLFIIVIIILGYYFVFEKGVNKKSSTKEVEQDEEIENMDNYIVIWKTKDSEDEEIITDYELTIIKIDGATVIFDLKLSEKYVFNNQFGDLEDNRATFEIDSELAKVSGDLTFKDNYIYISIISSSDEDEIPIGTMRFDNKE